MWSYGSWIYNYLCNQCAYHYESCDFESRSWRGVLNTTLSDKVCQLLAIGQWFSSGILLSSTIKTEPRQTPEILLKVVLNTITLTPKFQPCKRLLYFINLTNTTRSHTISTLLYIPEELNQHPDIHTWRVKSASWYTYLKS